MTAVTQATESQSNSSQMPRAPPDQARQHKQQHQARFAWLCMTSKRHSPWCQLVQLMKVTSGFGVEFGRDIRLSRRAINGSDWVAVGFVFDYQNARLAFG
jgi:hypothetical protein